jgi:uncharacterized protein (DUF952 family)
VRVALFHITTDEMWAAAQRVGAYQPASLATEGFIHLSDERQWLATANRFYRGRRDLVLLAIREDRLAAPVRWEPADGQHFPHLYGSLELAAVIGVLALPVAADGAIAAPPGLADLVHQQV